MKYIEGYSRVEWNAKWQLGCNDDNDHDPGPVIMRGQDSRRVNSPVNTLRYGHNQMDYSKEIEANVDGGE